ncbi:MAG: helix-turn-helix transcriptional regulator [Actinomycetota bacterium]|nr:helix-turn-helix transcriptional regulator [Actinomycetota bacterium]
MIREGELAPRAAGTYGYLLHSVGTAATLAPRAQQLYPNHDTTVLGYLGGTRGRRSSALMRSWPRRSAPAARNMRRSLSGYPFAEVHRPGATVPGHRRGAYLGEEECLVDLEEAWTIGARARMIRRRRGLSLEVVAGLAGITAQYLSMLERGLRGFNRRGLIEDLAEALGCSVADLTGQPYPAPDRATIEGRAALPGISLALNDFGPDDVPDITPRPLDELVAWADSANEHRDQGRWALAGRDLGTLLTELQAHALTAGSADRDRTFTALVQSCILAGDVAKALAGNIDLVISAARRGYDMACRHGDPGLIGFAQWRWSLPLIWLTARGRASRLLTVGIDELGRSVHLRSETTLPAEMLGMMHLAAAQCAARSKQSDDARMHLAEAEGIAARIGECNGMRMHFGPTNVTVWRLGIGVEMGEGGHAYEVSTRTPPDMAVLNSNDRASALHFDLARALVQDGPNRDAEAIRHLDTADRLAPTRIRNDPIARDLVVTLDRRARRRVWELDSLGNRFGIRSARA